MTPALTKAFKDGPGIHSCPCSVGMDSEGTATCCSELKSQMKSVEDDDLQKLWPLLSSLPPQSSCLPVDVFSLSQDQVVLLPYASPLPILLSAGEDAAKRSQQDACVFPGGLDMFERNCQEACLPYGRSPSHKHGPGGGDVPHTPLPCGAPSASSQAETKQRDCSPVVVPASAWIQGEEGPMGSLSPPLQQSFCSRSTSEQPRAMLTDALRPRLSRQVGLRGKAQRLQRRLQVLLGEHAVRHCSQQLGGLKRQLDGPAFSHISPHPGPLPTLTDPSVDLSSLAEFSQSSQAVLRGLQGALDSEATLSSSSDDESPEVRGRPGAADLSGSQERRRLEERAELGSRWSWLQVRLEDLEERTRQMVELHKHIRSTKGRVVLADSQPLTDTQIQRTLLREMAGLSCTAMDTDNEPCSPTRLLYNIERQSAQLSQFVNSLLPPLSFSPVKQPQSCKHPKAFLSGQTNGPFLPRSSNRRRLLSSGTCKAEMSCVCARTRPLVSFHKPRLFALDTSSPTCPPDSGKSTSLLSSSFSYLSRSSSDGVVPCSDPDSTSSSSLTSWTFNPTAPTASHFSFDNTMAKPGREKWSLRPLTGDIRPYGPTEHGQRSSTPVHSSQKLYNRHRRRSSSRVLDLSPIEVPGSSIPSRSRRANRKKRKRRHIHRPVDEKDVLYQLCDTEDSLDEFQEQRYTKVPPRQSPQGFVGKRRGESVYNINNIVIHMLAAKMEKLQYKVIMTPSWRVSDPSSLIHKETEDEDGQEEDLADNVFAQRHLELEHREKSRWASWGTRKCHRRPKRCGDRSFGCRGGMLTSGEESSAEWRWAQLDTDEEQRSEEWLPQSPWERRMFPLNEDEEKALFGDNITYKPSERLSVCGSTPITPKNANSQLCPALLTGASSPSGGQNKNS